MVFKISTFNNKPDKLSLDAIKFLDSEYFKWPWSQNSWDILDSGRDFIYTTISDNHEIMGFTLFDVDLVSKSVHLLKIIISPKYRGGAGASKLFEHDLARLRSMSIDELFLEVDKSNDRAINFYLKFGLKQIHIKRKFYKDGSDAVIMMLKL